MRALTRARLHSQTHRLTHSHSMRSHVASAVACAYGGVRDSVQMRRCSRRQRCCQILRARWPRRTLRCAQARQRSCESRRPVSSARAVVLGTQPVRAECRSTSRRSMDNDAAACDTGKGMTAECALPCPCASPLPARARRSPSRVRPRPCCCGDELCARWCSTQHACKAADGPLTTPGVPPWGTADCTRSHPSFDARSPRLTPQHCSAPRRLGEHCERHYAVIAGMRRRRMSSRTTRQRRLWWLRLLQALG